MNKRFAQLMAKGQNGRLTLAETEELAQLLNAPIIEPLGKPASRFRLGPLLRSKRHLWPPPRDRLVLALR